MRYRKVDLSKPARGEEVSLDTVERERTEVGVRTRPRARRGIDVVGVLGCMESFEV
jgi:hypothetical protein